jgi:transcriptional regulator with XRE-family HTH domain
MKSGSTAGHLPYGEVVAVRCAAYMADADRESLGETIRTARTTRDMKLRELARRVELTPSYISDIENDRRTPSEEVLRRIAGELGIDFEEIMARAGRFGSDADRYLRQRPAATTLFRRMHDRNLSDEQIRRLIDGLDELRSPEEPGS